jgi:SAM-dependent methyltransferase
MTDRFDIYARFYDPDLGDWDADMALYEQFAARCGSPILELGCGTGRVLLPLARQGYRITGIDASAAMLDQARQKLAKEDLAGSVTLVQQEMRELDLAERFTLALAALNSFAHLHTTAEQLAALARVRRHLEPGGLLILDLFNPDMARLLDARGQVSLARVMVDPGTGHRLMRFYAEEVDLEQQLIHTTYIVDEIDAGGRVQRTLFPFSLRYTFRYELELLLRHAGFEIEAIYGSYDLDEFSGDSEQMIAVASRPRAARRPR